MKNLNKIIDKIEKNIDDKDKIRPRNRPPIKIQLAIS